MQLKKFDGYVLDNKTRVKVIKQGNKFIDIVYCKNKNLSSYVKKIDKESYYYIDKETGAREIRKYKKNENRADSIESLKRSFKNLMQLIRTNFLENRKNQLFLTLTYRENMQDKDKLYKDFDRFMKKLKYKFKESKFEYIAVAEPQERGAWHLHIMLKDIKNKSLFIDNKDLEEMWGHGWTDCQRLKSDDLGAYYVAYFTNLELEQTEEEEKKNGKRYVKGSRLSLYPTGMKFYRCSRGIKRPKEYFATLGQVIEEYGNPVWEQAYSLEEDEEVKNIIYKASFKKWHKLKDIKTPHLKGLYKKLNTGWREEIASLKSKVEIIKNSFSKNGIANLVVN